MKKIGTERRGFIKSLLVVVFSLFGVKEGVAKLDNDCQGDDLEPSFRWLKEQMIGHWQLRKPLLRRCWEPRNVSFTQVNCGAGTCPPGPEEEGFRVIILTAKHRYAVVAKPHYLGCVCSNREPLPGETWTRGCDLADGKRTVGTWHRIVADIERMETKGSKYASS